MPFSPLPGIFTEDLDRLGATGVLELGSGHGAFTDVLRELGQRPWTIDHAGPWRGVRPDVVCDAIRPGVRGPFGMVVAANLLRHVWTTVSHEGPVVWADLLSPGGTLWILEDEPLRAPASADNYRRLQNLLAELQPGEHEALLPAVTFETACRGWNWPGSWQFGTQPNGWPADVDRVLSMLAGGDPAPGSEVAELMDSIVRSGVSYGHCWWARWQGRATA